MNVNVGKNFTMQVGEQSNIHIDGDSNLSVGENSSVRISQDSENHIEGNESYWIGKKKTIDIMEDVKIKSYGELSIECEKELLIAYIKK